ncbi:MAG: cation diffusion facilitator family transporter [Kofleriaceae bacterium]
MSDEHDHAPPPTMTSAFAIGMSLNVVFVIVGVIAGIAAHSTALLADAAHNLGDVLGLGMAWGAMSLAKRARSVRRTYGLRRTTILAALANGGLVLFAIGGVAWEAIHQLAAPPKVQGGVVALVAALGVVINAGAAMLFAKGRHGDVNIRGAFLHLMADAAVSAGVVVSGLIVWKTDIAWIDPVASLVVSIVILFGTWKLLREALDLLLDAVPERIDPVAVAQYLESIPGVTSVHDLHIWSMTTTEAALTAHLKMPWEKCSPTLIRETSEAIERQFAIHHVTIQIEPDDGSKSCDENC